MSSGSTLYLSQQGRILLLYHLRHITQSRLSQVHAEMCNSEFVGDMSSHTFLVGLVELAAVELNRFVLNALVKAEICCGADTHGEYVLMARGEVRYFKYYYLVGSLIQLFIILINIVG